MDWRAGWALVRSRRPGELQLRGVFATQQDVFDAIPERELGQPGNATFVTFPLTANQLERLSGRTPGLSPTAHLVAQARANCFGVVRLMSVGADRPLWLGERSPAEV